MCFEYQCNVEEIIIIMMMMTKGRRRTTKKSFNIIFLPSSTRDTYDILLVLFLNKFPFTFRQRLCYYHQM